MWGIRLCVCMCTPKMLLLKVMGFFFFSFFTIFHFYSLISAFVCWFGRSSFCVYCLLSQSQSLVRALFRFSFFPSFYIIFFYFYNSFLFRSSVNSSLTVFSFYFHWCRCRCHCHWCLLFLYVCHSYLFENIYIYLSIFYGGPRIHYVYILSARCARGICLSHFYF